VFPLYTFSERISSNSAAGEYIRMSVSEAAKRNSFE
jgi:hypothetical protein